MPRAPAASLFSAAAVCVLQGGTRAAKTCAASQTADAASPATVATATAARKGTGQSPPIHYQQREGEQDDHDHNCMASENIVVNVFQSNTGRPQ